LKLLKDPYVSKTLLVIVVVLTMFLVVVDTIFYQHHKYTLYSDFKHAKQDELKLLAVLSRDALLKQDYPAVERLFMQWGREQQCVVELKLIKTDGTILARYQRSKPAAETVTVASKVTSNGKSVLGLELVEDAREISISLEKILIEMGIISLLIMLVLALSISIVLQKLAIAPLEEEVSMRKRLLVKMRRISNERQRLLESAGEGIFSLRRDGICTFINDAALAMLGFGRSEIIGKNLHDLIHHTDLHGNHSNKADCRILSSLNSGEGVIVDEDCFWRSDGASIPVMYSAFPLEEGGAHTGVVVVFHDITEQQTKRMILEHQATHDPLTSVMNRREFERRLDRAVETARQEHKEHILLYMDLDNFKQVNDAAGHHAGDELLRRVAKKISALMRERDTLARLGGDEFAVLLENCSVEVAVRIGSEINHAVCAEKFSWEGRQFVIGISIGLAEVNQGCANSDAALDAADGACYLAKQLGGCQVQIWSQELLNNNKIH
jgi:diguanylate cyclase (GGDEF)-like protein/PAS domain S-box-containing protein